MKKFNTLEEAKEYGKDFRKYQSEYISVDGEDVILCGTDMAYEEELWGDAYALVENFFNNWSEADDYVCTDLATEIREMILEKFSEVKNIKFVDVYDEY